MPKERIIVGLATSKAIAAGPDIAIRRFANAKTTDPCLDGETEGTQISFDFEKADSIIAAADEEAKIIGNQYLGMGDMSVAKSGEGLNVHVAVQAWPQSALVYLAQLNQGTITSFQRQPLLLIETWQHMVEMYSLVHTKAETTANLHERERLQVHAALDEEMDITLQRSVEAQASIKDLRNCQNNIINLMAEIENQTNSLLRKWADDRLALVTQGKTYFETMASQHKSCLMQIDIKSQQHKFETMPQLTKGWRDGARYYYDMIVTVFRHRIMPVLVNKHCQEQLEIILQQNFMDQPGLTLNMLVLWCGKILKVDTQSYKLQASAVYLPQAMRKYTEQVLPQTVSYEHIDVAATRHMSLFRAGGELVRQWCQTAMCLQVNESAANVVFRAAIMLSVLVDEAESVDAAITSFHDTDSTRAIQSITAHRDQSIGSVLKKLRASVDDMDKAVAANVNLAAEKRKLSQWIQTWEKIRNDMPAEVAAFSPSQNRWFRLVSDEHKAKLNRIMISVDTLSAQKILDLLRSGV